MNNFHHRYEKFSQMEERYSQIKQKYLVGKHKNAKNDLLIWFKEFKNLLEVFFPNELVSFNRIEQNWDSRVSNQTLYSMFKNDIDKHIESIFKEINKNMENENEPSNRKKIFIIQGRNSPANKKMRTFIHDISLEPMDFSEARGYTGKPSPSVPEIIDAAFSNAQALIVFMTPDDIGFLDEKYRSSTDPDEETEPRHRCRQNVVFEAGMAMGRDPNRVVFVDLGNVKKWSDLITHYVRISEEGKWKADLINRLKDAGCKINIKGDSYMQNYDFMSTIK